MAQEAFRQPDADRKRVDEVVHRLRRSLQEGEPAHGLVRGPLMIAAEHLVDELLVAHGLGDEHRLPVTEFLVGVWGEVAHAFPESAEVIGYYDWRAASRARVLEG